MVTEKEKRLTAYHEAGHAITHYYCKTADPVHEISIIPRGMAGGYTMSLPEKDQSYVTKTQMQEQIVTLLGSVVFLASVVLGLHSLWQKFTGHALEGFTTVILLQLLIGSILMICLGIIGYYIAKIYEEIKDRPRYILAEHCGGNDESASGKTV